MPFFVLISIILWIEFGVGLHIIATVGFEFTSDFWIGFTTWSYQLRHDMLVLMFLLPLTVGLFLKSRKGLHEADSILILVGGILLLGPLLIAFTWHDIHPYRFIPLIFFFAVGVGLLISKKTTLEV